MLLSYCFNGSLLGDFFDDSGFFYGGSRSVFVLDVEESSVELSICQVAAWVGRMEGIKIPVLCTFLLYCFCGSFLGCFPVIVGFLGKVAMHSERGMFRLQS